MKIQQDPQIFFSRLNTVAIQLAYGRRGQAIHSLKQAQWALTYLLNAEQLDDVAYQWWISEGRFCPEIG